MDVPHEPVEYIYVAMHTDVDIIHVLRFTQVLLEIFHRSDQQRPIAFEILVLLLVFVAHVDQYLVIYVVVVVPSFIYLIIL